MSKTRLEFAPEFKREAVVLLESSGRPLIQVAAVLGIQPSMLRAWRAMIQDGIVRSRPKACGNTGTALSGPSPADLASQNAKLKRDRMCMERDVLEKAIGIFAEVPR